MSNVCDAIEQSVPTAPAVAVIARFAAITFLHEQDVDEVPPRVREQDGGFAVDGRMTPGTRGSCVCARASVRQQSVAILGLSVPDASDSSARRSFCPRMACARPLPQGTPEVLPSPILRRISSTSQSHAVPGSTRPE